MKGNGKPLLVQAEASSGSVLEGLDCSGFCCSPSRAVMERLVISLFPLPEPLKIIAYTSNTSFLFRPACGISRSSVGHALLCLAFRRWQVLLQMGGSWVLSERGQVCCICTCSLSFSRKPVSYAACLLGFKEMTNPLIRYVLDLLHDTLSHRWIPTVIVG